MHRRRKFGSHPRTIWRAPGKLFNQIFPGYSSAASLEHRYRFVQIAPLYAEHATDRRSVAHSEAFWPGATSCSGPAVQPMQIDGECAGGERRTRRGANLRIFQRLRKLGLDIRYIGLDEPLTLVTMRAEGSGHANSRSTMWPGVWRRRYPKSVNGIPLRGLSITRLRQ